MMTVVPNSTEIAIYQELNTLAYSLYGKRFPDSRWTADFKKSLRALGERSGYVVWGEDKSEWLFDLSWAYAWPDFKGLVLACEIEWCKNDRDQLNDFYKLTVCDCAQRAFIFQCDRGDEERKFDLFQGASPFAIGKRFMAIAVPPGWQQDLPFRCWDHAAGGGDQP